MDTKTFSKTINNARTAITRDSVYLRNIISKRRQQLKDAEKVLKLLPGPGDDLTMMVTVRSFIVDVEYLPNDQEECNRVRSEIQGIFHDVIAIRKVHSYNGQVYFAMELPLNVSVEISNGSLAPGCEIKKVSTTEYQYKIVCETGVKPEEGIETEVAV